MNQDRDPLFTECPQAKDCMPMSSACALTETTTAASAAIVTSPCPMGPSKTVTVCPHCQATVKTSIKHTTTTRTHMSALLCCFTCCCCCIPYCMDSTRNTDHYCPLCDRYLGTYEK